MEMCQNIVILIIGLNLMVSYNYNFFFLVVNIFATFNDLMLHLHMIGIRNQEEISFSLPEVPKGPSVANESEGALDHTFVLTKHLMLTIRTLTLKYHMPIDKLSF